MYSQSFIGPFFKHAKRVSRRRHRAAPAEFYLIEERRDFTRSQFTLGASELNYSIARAAAFPT
jgi:hypothetical protein